MSKKKERNRKTQALKRHGTLHPHAELVKDELFCQHDFFDPRDAVQVKYEMLRRTRVDGWPASRAAQQAGFSRPTFYEAQIAFDSGGLPALLPPVHYLALLERKPGALDFARPLENWRLPACFDILRRRLEVELDHQGTREYIKVLRLLEKTSIPQLADTIEQALAINALSADAVRVILEGRREQPVGVFNLDERPHLKLVHVQSPDLGAYRVLAGGAS